MEKKNFFQKVPKLHNRKKKLFFQYFLILLGCIAITTTIIGLYTYNYSKNMIDKEIGYSNYRQLETTKKLLEVSVMEIKRTAMRFVIDEEIVEYSKYGDTQNVLLINDISRKINILDDVNKIVHSIYIYFEKDDKIVSSINGESYLFKEFYDKNWKADYNKLKTSEVTNLRKFSRVVGNNVIEADVISLLNSVPLIGNKLGAIVINIDQRYLIEHIISGVDNDYSTLYLVDEKSEIIASTDESVLYKKINTISSVYENDTDTPYYTEFIGEDKYIISQVKSSALGWRLISVVPTEYLYKDLEKLKTKFVGFAVYTIIIGVFFALIASYKLYSPIKGLVKNVSDYLDEDIHNWDEGEIEMINSSFMTLTDINNGLEEQYIESRPLMRIQFLRMLLTSNLIDETEFLKKKIELNLNINGKSYIVIIFAINKSDQRRSYQSLGEYTQINRKTLNYLRKEFEPCEMIEVDIHNIAMILSFDEYINSEEIRDIIHKCTQLNNVDNKKIEVGVYSGIGQVVDNIEDVQISYFTALESLKYRHTTQDNDVVYFGDIESMIFSDRDMMYIEEEALINFIMSGEVEEANNLIDEIIDRLRKQKITFSMFQGIIVRILGDIDIKTTEHNIFSKDEDSVIDVNLIYEFSGIEEISNYLKKVVGIIDVSIKQRRTNKYWRQIEKTLIFIETHYHEDLGLDEIALHAGMSTSHFSRVLKSELGKTYIEYISDIRMKKAKELLEETELKIKIIAERVGINNPTYFSKMFRECYNISPNQYRLAFKKEK